MKNRINVLLSIFFFFFSISAFAAEKVYFYHTDPAGTPLAMSDSDGSVVWRADYKPFGEEYAVEETRENDKRFVGKEKDEETGHLYFGARYMDAKTGRFTALDSIRAVDPSTNTTNEKLLLNPQQLNPYAYALSNPYRYVDPDGNTVWDVLDFAFFGISLYVFATDPSWSHGGDLALDTVGLLPIVPSIGVVKMVGKAVKSETRFIHDVEIVSHGKVIDRGTVDLKPTLDRIESGTHYPHANDGSIFNNREGLLPSKEAGYYREYVHPTPGVNGPGPQRIITGNGGEKYYTPDHYKSFIPLN